MVQRQVAIVVDSASCLPAVLVQEYDLWAVPHEVRFEEQTFRDGVDIQPAEFYRLLQSSEVVPSTAAPSPRAFLEAFQQAAEQCPQVLCLTLPANLSSTHNNARLAVEMAARTLLGVPIRVVDTRTAAGGEGLVALECARAAARGASLEEVIRVAESLIPHVYLVAFLDTLFFLWKGGRIPKVAAWAGSLLRVKPLMDLYLGEARLLERPRSRTKATERLLTVARERSGGRQIHANVMHANCPEDAQALATRVEGEVPCVEVVVSEFTPVMGAHTGPGLLGVAFFTEDA